MALKTPKKIRTRRLRTRVWNLWSKKVRKDKANWQGYVECYTCLVKKPMKEMQAGHYIHGKLDFDERNIKPQCVKCNMYLSGNLGKYAERLIREHGEKWVEELRRDAARDLGYKEEDLQKILLTLKQ